VSLLALEGSMLTVLGTVSLDTKTNMINITDVASFVGGGMKEALSYIKYQSAVYYTWRNAVFVTAACFLVPALLTSLSWVAGLFTKKKMEETQKKQI
jgi:hypothetical protein